MSALTTKDQIKIAAAVKIASRSKTANRARVMQGLMGMLGKAKGQASRIPGISHILRGSRGAAARARPATNWWKNPTPLSLGQGARVGGGIGAADSLAQSLASGEFDAADLITKTLGGAGLGAVGGKVPNISRNVLRGFAPGAAIDFGSKSVFDIDPKSRYILGAGSGVFRNPAGTINPAAKSYAQWADYGAMGALPLGLGVRGKEIVQNKLFPQAARLRSSGLGLAGGPGGSGAWWDSLPDEAKMAIVAGLITSVAGAASGNQTLLPLGLGAAGVGAAWPQISQYLER